MSRKTTNCRHRVVESVLEHNKQIGLETMCVGGGQGMAMVLERLS